jgi:hypothetical protein
VLVATGGTGTAETVGSVVAAAGGGSGTAEAEGALALGVSGGGAFPHATKLEKSETRETTSFMAK